LQDINSKSIITSSLLAFRHSEPGPKRPEAGGAGLLGGRCAGRGVRRCDEEYEIDKSKMCGVLRMMNFWEGVV
jgi:hypothetical protein